MSRNRSAARWLPLGVALVAFLVYATLWSAGPSIEGDSVDYLEMARDLGDFRLDELHLRTPGYPWFLLLTGSSQQPSRQLVWAQLLLYLGATLALGRALGRVATCRWTETGFVLVACLPHVAQPAQWLLAESLTQSLLALAMAALAAGLFARQRTILVVAAGLLFAAGGTVRPVYQALPIALAATLILLAMVTRDRRRSYLAGAALLALPTLLLAGFTAASNTARFGAPSSPHLAFALAARMSNYVEYLPDEQAALRDILVRHRDATLLSERHHISEGFIFPAWEELLEHYRGDAEAARKDLLRASVTLIRAEPRTFFRLAWESTARYWEWFSSAPPGLRHPVAIALPFALHHLSVACFAAGTAVMLVVTLLWRTLGPATRDILARRIELPRRVRHLLLAFLTCILAAMLLQVTVGVGVPRYRLPTEPLVLFVVAFYVDRFFRVRQALRQIES